MDAQHWLVGVGTFRRLVGVKDSTYYGVFKQLNVKVIKPAVVEVNKTSDIIVTPETRKMGRRVTHIRFKIKENPQLAILDIDDWAEVRNSPVYATLVGQGSATVWRISGLQNMGLSMCSVSSRMCLDAKMCRTR